jgi:hypothetical protein
MRSLLFALLTLAAASPSTQQSDIEAAKRGVAAVEAALAQRPNDATLYFFLARFHAQAGNRDGAVAALTKAAELGDGFLPARELGFEKVWDDPRFQKVRGDMEVKLPRLDFAPIAFEVDDTRLVPEGIAYDAPSHSFFLGSIVERKIVRVSDEGRVSDFALGLDSVLGIAVEAPRRILYAVSTSALTQAGRKSRRNAIVAYDVDSLRQLRRVDVPEAMQLNDVAVAPGGRVFTTDSASGAVFEILKDGTTRTLVRPGELRGSNGLAPSADGTRLYVAHSTGLAVVDVAAGGGAKRVANRTRETVAAIDGLYQWQGQLVGVQNTTTPGRVILVTLSSDGEAIERVQTLLSHHHNRLDEPTTGAITERGFFLLAATGVGHYDDRGEIERPDSMPKPTVLRIPLPR